LNFNLTIQYIVAVDNLKVNGDISVYVCIWMQWLTCKKDHTCSWTRHIS